MRSEQSQGGIHFAGRALLVVAASAVLFVGLVIPWPADWIGIGRRGGELVLPRSAVGDLRPGPLSAGVARYDFTTDVRGLPLAGYGKRVFTPSQGVADPLYFTAIVLDNSREKLALVHADLLMVTPPLAAAALAKLRQAGTDWSRERVFFCATHTHAGPAGLGGSLLETIGSGWMDPQLIDRLADRIADVIVRANGDLVPVTWAACKTQVSPGLIRNRVIPDGPVNRWLDLFCLRRFEQPRGSRPANAESLLAVVAVFSAHATCSPVIDPRISADYPGVCRELIEQRHGGTCIVLAGGVGSMAPGTLEPTQQRTSRNVGTPLADHADALLTAPLSFERQIVLGTQGAHMILPPPQVKVDGNWRLPPSAAAMVLPDHAWLQVIRLGNLFLAGTPADYSGILAEQLRHAHPEHLVVATSFNGDYIGYLLPESYDALPSYEPRRLSFFGPRVGEMAQDRLIELASRLMVTGDLR